MIIDEIKKANVEALKAKDQVLRGIYSVIMNKYMQAGIEARTTGKEVGDAEITKIIQKTIKELEEEANNYSKVGNIEESEKINKQKQAIEKYLPKMLTAEEIYNEISAMEDKSVPVVMRALKAKFGANIDMKLASEVLKKF